MSDPKAKTGKRGRKKSEDMHLQLTHRIEWGLLPLLTRHKIRTGVELKRLLDGIGYEITSIHAARLLSGTPKQVPINLLEALVTVLKCRLSDIIYEVPINSDDATFQTPPENQSQEELAQKKKDRPPRAESVSAISSEPSASSPSTPSEPSKPAPKTAKGKILEMDRTVSNLANMSFRSQKDPKNK